MDPLSRKKRSWYMALGVLVFLVAAPILILYASGYRFDTTLGFATTGGVNISAPLSGAEIYLAGSLVRTTSIFQKNVFVQNLKPGSYQVAVKKDGYQDWNKTLVVFPETVTDAYSFILPTKPLITPILAKVPDPALVRATGTSTGVKLVANPDYTAVVTLFKATTTPSEIPTTASSTMDAKEFRKLLVEKVDGQLKVTWTGDVDSKPSYFCENETCKDEIYIKPASVLKSFDFFPGRGDLIIMSEEDGVFVSEIDDRSAQNVETLSSGDNTDFRVKDGDRIFLKQDTTYYSVSL